MSDHGMREELSIFQTLRVRVSAIWRKVSWMVIEEEADEGEEGWKRIK
jgi:hypothetical protein